MNGHSLHTFSDSQAIITEHEAWVLSCMACVDQARADVNRRYPDVGVRLFFEGCQDERKTSALMPAKEDRGFKGYMNRISLVTGKRSSLNIGHFHTLSWAVYKRLLRVVESLGYGAGERPIYVGLFTSCDRYSAAGAHLDPNYQEFIQYVVAGKKRAYLWDADSLSATDKQLLLNSSDIQPLAEKSTIIEAGTGEVLQWPGKCFHIMENLTDYSVGLTVGFRTDSVAYPLTDLTEVLLECVQCATKQSTQVESDPTKEVAETSERLLMMLNDTDAIEKRLLKKRLRAQSSRGLHHSPPLITTPVDASTKLFCPSDMVVVCQHHGAIILVSCAGHVHEFHHQTTLVEKLLRESPNSPETAMTTMEICTSIGEDTINAVQYALEMFKTFVSIGAAMALK